MGPILCRSIRLSRLRGRLCPCTAAVFFPFRPRERARERVGIIGSPVTSEGVINEGGDGCGRGDGGWLSARVAAAAAAGGGRVAASGDPRVATKARHVAAASADAVRPPPDDTNRAARDIIPYSIFLFFSVENVRIEAIILRKSQSPRVGDADFQKYSHRGDKITKYYL